MKRLIMMAAVLCLLCASALADTAYSVLPAEIDEKALLQVTFLDRADNARKEVREGGQIFFDLDTDGPPFCLHSSSPVQSSFGAFRTEPNGPEEYIGPKNVWPSGIAECALTREDALAQSEALLQALRLGEYALQSVTAYGRIPGFRDDYHIAFLQRLNGRAVYWSSCIQPPDDDIALENEPRTVLPQTNRVEIVLDENGLLSLTGAWCRYEPTGGEVTPMDETQAAAAFEKFGMAADGIELCYYLQYDGQGATAIPAWRYHNSFLHAETGELLQ